MSDRKHAKLMLDMADADIQALRNMTDAGNFAESVFGFHCQQAVEKLLKAWLSLEGVAYPRTHDLRTLMQLLEAGSPGRLGPFLDLVDLTDYAVQFRYEAPMDLHLLDRAGLRDRILSLRRKMAGLL